VIARAIADCDRRNEVSPRADRGRPVGLVCLAGLSVGSRSVFNGGIRDVTWVPPGEASLPYLKAR